MLILALDAILGVAVLTCAALGAGGWIGRWLPQSFSRLERLTFSLLGGYGILSLLVFLIGQFAFTRLTVLVIVVPCSLASIPYARQLYAGAEPWKETIRRMPALPLLVIAALTIFTALTNLAEIAGDSGNDTVAYHLLGPKLWVQNGLIRPVPDHSHTAFPQTAETIYGALLLLSGNRAPQFSTVLTFSLLLLTSFSVARRCGLTASEAIWATVLVGTMPTVYGGSIGCFVDGLYAAFVLAAFRVGSDAAETKSWTVFGIFCGLAMATKYTGILAFPALILCAAFLHRRERWPNTLRRLLVSASVAGLVAAPYYIRNAILLGCPIYPPPPGLVRICSAKFMTSEAAAQFQAYIRQRGAGMGGGLKAFLLLPFHLTYHTSLFHGAGGIGLAPLALGPIGIASSWKNDFVKAGVLLVGCLTVLWFLTQQESRFLIHVYVLGAVFAAIGLHVMWTENQRLSRALAMAVVALSVCYGGFMIWREGSDGLRAVVSPSFAKQRHAQGIPYLESFQYLNTDPNVKLVLILDRTLPPYYLDKHYIKPEGQWGERTLPGAIDSQEALQQAASLHVTHVLDVRSTISDFKIRDHPKNLQLVVQSADQRVYRVIDEHNRD